MVHRPSSGYFFLCTKTLHFPSIASEEEGAVEYFVLVFLAFSLLQSTRRSSAVCKSLAQLKLQCLLTLAANQAKQYVYLYLLKTVFAFVF